MRFSTSIIALSFSLCGTTATAQDSIDHWKALLGKRITVQGEAHNAKMGAMLVGEESTIWVDLPDEAWPDGFYKGNDEGELVVVTGTVAQRADLPVFIAEPGEPIMMAGIPMPPGTDLEEARKRYVLVDVVWQRLTPQR